MRINNNLIFKNHFRKSVVAVGVFDGVHKAHRFIIRSCVKEAERIGARSVVVTFWPHPQGKNSLYSLKHRLRIIEGMGVSDCVIISFNHKFSRVSAQSFVKNILVDKLHTQAVYVGKNFRFGKNAEGDVELLKKLSRVYGFKMRAFEVRKVGRHVISSTLIRDLITRGKLRRAEKILLRPVTVLGTVIKGELLATKLGFPTANINPHHEILPPKGIYAVRVILGRKTFPAICYIGGRPTFFKRKPNSLADTPTIEVHIFNFNKNIYGKDIEIQFMQKIRDEKKFACRLALVNQIKKDVKKTKNIFLLH
jgi:riboflavin kinase/FMN adenylyltransferase